MVDSLQQYKQIAQDLIERDRETKGTIMPEMDKLGENDWVIPEGPNKLKWLVPRIDSAPRNAEIAGVRSLATMWPTLKIELPGSNEQTKKRYNQIEDALGYQFMLASNRPSYDMPNFGNTPVERLLRSSIRYGEIAAQVIHVEAQMQFMGSISKSRENAIRKYGDFYIPVHNPQSVHAQVSGLGLEGVLLKKHQTLKDFVDFWGDKAKPILKSVKEELYNSTYVVSYDYTNHDIRAVWADINSMRTPTYDSYNGEGKEILLIDNDLGFLNWVWRGGVEPMNYAAWKTGAWDSANVAETLAYSDQIKHASYPRLDIETMNRDNVEVDYTDPANPLYHDQQTKVKPMEPPQINEGHVIMGDRARADLKAMTVPNVVTALDSAANEAYATFDQRLRSGMAAYEPFKQQVERGLEDIFCHMLWSAQYVEKPISSPYVTKGRNGVRSFSMDEKGQPFTIALDTYGYDVRPQVVLEPGEPLDDQQKMMAASNAVQYLNVSRSDALETVGWSNPEELERNKALEVMKDAKLQGKAQKIVAQDAYEAQLINAGLAEIIPYVTDPNIGPQIVQILQQMVGQMQMAEQQAQSGEAPLPNPQNPQGLQGVEGQMFDASQGGTPAAVANPAGNAAANFTGERA